MAKRERKGFSSSIPKERALEDIKEQLQEQETIEEKGTVRITLDIPKGFHKQLKTHTKSLGQTLKGYFLWLPREDLKKENRQ